MKNKIKIKENDNIRVFDILGEKIVFFLHTILKTLVVVVSSGSNIVIHVPLLVSSENDHVRKKRGGIARFFFISCVNSLIH